MPLELLPIEFEECLLIKDRLIDREKTVIQAGLLQGGCLSITRYESFYVYDEKGHRRRVKADLGDRLSALRKQLNLPKRVFHLWCGVEELCDENRSLFRLGIDRGSRILALPKKMPVVLKSHGMELVRMEDVRKDISFVDFLKKSSAALKMKLSPKTRFRCRCERVFSDETALRREFPRHCCPCNELSLTIEGSPKGEWCTSVECYAYNIERRFFGELFYCFSFVLVLRVFWEISGIYFRWLSFIITTCTVRIRFLGLMQLSFLLDGVSQTDSSYHGAEMQCHSKIHHEMSHQRPKQKHHLVQYRLMECN